MNTEELIKKQTNWTKAVFGALAAIVAAIIIFGVILVPKVNKAIDHMEESLTHVNVLIDDAEEALENINKVDFDSLSRSIENLTTITDAIAKIFGGGSDK